MLGSPHRHRLELFYTVGQKLRGGRQRGGEVEPLAEGAENHFYCRKQTHSDSMTC